MTEQSVPTWNGRLVIEPVRGCVRWDRFATTIMLRLSATCSNLSWPGSRDHVRTHRQLKLLPPDMTRIDDLRFTILVDNVANSEALQAEHGFSCLIEADATRILFDTGAKDALLHNTRSLGVPLSNLDALVFSHGHYDHTGGLEAVVDQLGAVRVVAHPNLLGPHRSRRTGRDREIGITEGSRRAVNRLNAEFVAEPVEVAPGIWTTGEIPRLPTDGEMGELFVDSDGMRPDHVSDDMALVARHPSGLVVLLGCAHAGVVDTLMHIEQLFPNEPLLGVLGGMHLERAAPTHVKETVEYLQSKRLRFVSPGHCTGEQAKRALLEVYSDSLLPMQVGLEIRFAPCGQLSQAQLRT